MKDKPSGIPSDIGEDVSVSAVEGTQNKNGHTPSDKADESSTAAENPDAQDNNSKGSNSSGNKNSNAGNKSDKNNTGSGGNQGNQTDKDNANNNGNEKTLPLCDDRRDTIFYNSRIGSKGLIVYTPDGKAVDKTYEVSVDSNVGSLYWDQKWNCWGLSCEGKKAGATGFFYAEKDGKKYSLQCVVVGEPLSIFTAPPRDSDISANYLPSSGTSSGKLYINYAYRKGSKTTLYLAPAFGFGNAMPSCSSSKVSIRIYTGSSSYSMPIWVLTFENPNGGDTHFTVNAGEYPNITVNMKEK